MEQTINVLSEGLEQTIEIENEPLSIGIVPQGTLDITENGLYNITNYENANVQIPQTILQEKELTITENGTLTIEPDENYDALSQVTITTDIDMGLDWSQLGFSTTPDSIKKDYDYSTQIKENFTPDTNLSYKYQSNNNLIYMPTIDTSIATNMYSMFAYCGKLKSVAYMNTANVTNMKNIFDSCTDLQDIPIFNTSSLGYNMLNSAFQGCKNLTDKSLDNLLVMCVNATNYSGTKTLRSMFMSSSYYSVSRIQALPHYQNFINAGWTIGY